MKTLLLLSLTSSLFAAAPIVSCFGETHSGQINIILRPLNERSVEFTFFTPRDKEGVKAGAWINNIGGFYASGIVPHLLGIDNQHFHFKAQYAEFGADEEYPITNATISLQTTGLVDLECALLR